LFTARNETPSRADLSNLEKSRSFPSAHDRSPSADGGYMSTRSNNASAVDAMDEGDHKKASLTGSRSLRGPRLFSEVFALGCSIAFRWAAVSSFAW
jgi:hypothetical protein